MPWRLCGDAEALKSLLRAGELSQQSAQKLREFFDTYTVPHLNVYTAFLPLLKDEATSSYTFIAGSLGAP